VNDYARLENHEMTEQTAMSESLLASAFLFRFSVPCRRCEKRWLSKGLPLDASYGIPSFGELDGRPLFAEFRMGWDDAGIVFNVRVVGKTQTPWCRESRIDDSDGLYLWIDTRDTHNIHRASRFCHQFAFLPSGSGPGQEQATARLLTIHRARENPKPVSDRLLRSFSRHFHDGYELHGYIPAAVMTGYDPAEHPRLGFCYAVIDRELGWQTFSLGAEFPIQEDPSLWGTLELIES
jgi:hypothetical protein